MQLFITDHDPHRCSDRLYNNKTRAHKMITETQQILACAQMHFMKKVTIKKVDGKPYATPLSRMNHPVIQWVCKDERHASWVLEHLYHLRNAYEGTAFKNVWDNFLELSKYSPFIQDYSGIEFFNFAKADDKGLNFTHIEDTFEAYDLFLEAQGA